MNTVSRSTKITIGVLILCAVAAPLVLGIDNNYLINILCSYCYFGIMCCSLNLLLGYTGQISMGHAAFMMIGAYTYGILNKYYGVHFLLAVIAAVLMSFAAGLLLGAAADGRCHRHSRHCEVEFLRRKTAQLAILLYFSGCPASGFPVLLPSGPVQDRPCNAGNVQRTDCGFCHGRGYHPA